MKNYLELIPISAKVRKRQNRMTLFCIIISVFLVTVIFGMVEMISKMERTNLINHHGYWHISLKNVPEEVIAKVRSRSDVAAVSACDILNEEAAESFYIEGENAVLYGTEEAWATKIWNCVREGTFPQNEKEAMLSLNAKDILKIGIGDTIILDTPAGKTEYKISGFGEHDSEFNLLYDAVTVYMDQTAFSQIAQRNGRDISPAYYVRFRTDNNVTKRIAEIKKYGLSGGSLRENTALLGITGHSSNEYAQALYPIAGILFVLILMAGVLMIASSMNSNVAERTKFFGMMRCIGMSRRQVICFVGLEALSWCKTAIPIGVVLGILSTWLLCIWLKYGIKGEFTEIPLFQFGTVGIFLGAAVGILTVLIASGTPAKRAAKVSPIAAVSGNADCPNHTVRAAQTGFMKIETTLGINHAASAKKNLILMTGSFTLSIILFFGFSAGLDFANALLPSTNEWQPDFAITSKDNSCSIDKTLAAKLTKLPQIRRVYGTMAAIGIPVSSEKNVEKVTLVSYGEYMLECAEKIKVRGDFSKVAEDSDYVLLVYDPRSPLDVGDTVVMNGTRLTVAGIVSKGLFSDDVALICTEETFRRLTGESDYAMLCIQTAKGAEDTLIRSIRNLINDEYLLSDYRASNKETLTEYWAFRLVVYAFLLIIALIATLNIINSTSMSVSARTKQYGAMRAVGMDGKQLTRMIAAEVFTYAASGCFVGCLLGIPLNKRLFEAFITAYYGEKWHMPVVNIAIILAVVTAAAAAAVHAPAKRMKNMAVTETINEL